VELLGDVPASIELADTCFYNEYDHVNQSINQSLSFSLTHALLR